MNKKLNLQDLDPSFTHENRKTIVESVFSLLFFTMMCVVFSISCINTYKSITDSDFNGIIQDYFKNIDFENQGTAGVKSSMVKDFKSQMVRDIIRTQEFERRMIVTQLKEQGESVIADNGITDITDVFGTVENIRYRQQESNSSDNFIRFKLNTTHSSKLISTIANYTIFMDNKTRIPSKESIKLLNTAENNFESIQKINPEVITLSEFTRLIQLITSRPGLFYGVDQLLSLPLIRESPAALNLITVLNSAVQPTKQNQRVYLSIQIHKSIYNQTPLVFYKVLKGNDIDERLRIEPGLANQLINMELKDIRAKAQLNDSELLQVLDIEFNSIFCKLNYLLKSPWIKVEQDYSKNLYNKEYLLAELLVRKLGSILISLFRIFSSLKLIFNVLCGIFFRHCYVFFVEILGIIFKGGALTSSDLLLKEYCTKFSTENDLVYSDESTSVKLFLPENETTTITNRRQSYAIVSNDLARETYNTASLNTLVIPHSVTLGNLSVNVFHKTAEFLKIVFNRLRRVQPRSQPFIDPIEVEAPSRTLQQDLLFSGVFRDRSNKPIGERDCENNALQNSYPVISKMKLTGLETTDTIRQQHIRIRGETTVQTGDYRRVRSADSKVKTSYTLYNPGLIFKRIKMKSVIQAISVKKLVFCELKLLLQGLTKCYLDIQELSLLNYYFKFSSVILYGILKLSDFLLYLLGNSSINFILLSVAFNGHLTLCFLNLVQCSTRVGRIIQVILSALKFVLNTLIAPILKETPILCLELIRFIYSLIRLVVGKNIILFLITHTITAFIIWSYWALIVRYSVSQLIYMINLLKNFILAPFLWIELTFRRIRLSDPLTILIPISEISMRILNWIPYSLLSLIGLIEFNFLNPYLINLLVIITKFISPATGSENKNTIRLVGPGGFSPFHCILVLTIINSIFSKHSILGLELIQAIAENASPLTCDKMHQNYQFISALMRVKLGIYDEMNLQTNPVLTTKLNKDRLKNLKIGVVPSGLAESRVNNSGLIQLEPVYTLVDSSESNCTQYFLRNYSSNIHPIIFENSVLQNEDYTEKHDLYAFRLNRIIQFFKRTLPNELVEVTHGNSLVNLACQRQRIRPTGNNRIGEDYEAWFKMENHVHKGTSLVNFLNFMEEYEAVLSKELVTDLTSESKSSEKDGGLGKKKSFKNNGQSQNLLNARINELEVVLNRFKDMIASLVSDKESVNYDKSAIENLLDFSKLTIGSDHMSDDLKYNASGLDSKKNLKIMTEKLDRIKKGIQNLESKILRGFQDKDTTLNGMSQPIIIKSSIVDRMIKSGQTGSDKLNTKLEMAEPYKGELSKDKSTTAVCHIPFETRLYHESDLPLDSVNAKLLAETIQIAEKGGVRPAVEFFIDNSSFSQAQKVMTYLQCLDLLSRELFYQGMFQKMNFILEPFKQLFKDYFYCILYTGQVLMNSGAYQFNSFKYGLFSSKISQSSGQPLTPELAREKAYYYNWNTAENRLPEFSIKDSLAAQQPMTWSLPLQTDPELCRNSLKRNATLLPTILDERASEEISLIYYRKFEHSTTRDFNNIFIVIPISLQALFQINKFSVKSSRLKILLNVLIQYYKLYLLIFLFTLILIQMKAPRNEKRYENRGSELSDMLGRIFDSLLIQAYSLFYKVVPLSYYLGNNLFLKKVQYWYIRLSGLTSLLFKMASWTYVIVNELLFFSLLNHEPGSDIFTIILRSVGFLKKHDNIWYLNYFSLIIPLVHWMQSPINFRIPVMFHTPEIKTKPISSFRRFYLFTTLNAILLLLNSGKLRDGKSIWKIVDAKLALMNHGVKTTPNLRFSKYLRILILLIVLTKLVREYKEPGLTGFAVYLSMAVVLLTGLTDSTVILAAIDQILKPLSEFLILYGMVSGLVMKLVALNLDSKSSYEKLVYNSMVFTIILIGFFRSLMNDDGFYDKFKIIRGDQLMGEIGGLFNNMSSILLIIGYVILKECLRLYESAPDRLTEMFKSEKSDFSPTCERFCTTFSRLILENKYGTGNIQCILLNLIKQRESARLTQLSETEETAEKIAKILIKKFVDSGIRIQPVQAPVVSEKPKLRDTAVDYGSSVLLI